MNHFTPHPTGTLKQAVYAFRYSADVVESFIEKYSRATIFISKKLGITPKEFKYSLINLFMKRNAKWNMTREVIKRVHNQNLYPVLSPLSRDEFLKYLTVVRVIIDDEFMEGRISQDKDLTTEKS